MPDEMQDQDQGNQLGATHWSWWLERFVTGGIAAITSQDAISL